jgi:hypothetical protein
MGMRPRAIVRRLSAACLFAWLVAPQRVQAEEFVQWGVRAGDSCEDVSAALYGTPAHAALVARYNRVLCARGAPLREGLTLVMPRRPDQAHPARVDFVRPSVRAKPPEASWAPAATGMPLPYNAHVQTMDTGGAGVRFLDRSRIVLAERTLVIVYGSAGESPRSSTRTPMVDLELREGEVKAALRAMRGQVDEANTRPLEVDVAGGRVAALSSETVVAGRGQHATVSVFDGKARVSSGGKTVQVPALHGTRFERRKPPKPPKPLPAAPTLASKPAPIGVGIGQSAPIASAWNEVAGAKAYRVELSRDLGFDEVLVREEVDAEVRSFRAEGLPVGRYHFRVRAIDGDELLGIASTVESVALAVIEAPGASMSPDGAELRVDANGSLEVRAPSEVSVLLGGLGVGAGAMPLASHDGAILELRDGAEVRRLRIALNRAEPPASVEVSPPPVAPSAVEDAPADPLAQVDAPEPGRGPAFPLVPLSSRVDVRSYTPFARDAFGVGVTLGPAQSDGADLAGWVMASTAWGPASFDATLRTPGLAGDVASSTGGHAWLGGRVRIAEWAAGEGMQSVSPSLRIGLPAFAGAAARLDAGIALGGELGRLGYWVDLGLRPRLGGGSSRSPDAFGSYLLAGLSLDELGPFRAHVAVDAHAGFDDVRERSMTALSREVVSARDWSSCSRRSASASPVARAHSRRSSRLV